jgi:hypothetical protein
MRKASMLNRSFVPPSTRAALEDGVNYCVAMACTANDAVICTLFVT